MLVFINALQVWLDFAALMAAAEPAEAGSLNISRRRAQASPRADARSEARGAQMTADGKTL